MYKYAKAFLLHLIKAWERTLKKKRRDGETEECKLNLENSAVATGLEKVSFHSNPKECSNYRTIALISHASKVMLRILQARLQQYVNRDLPDVQAGFRKGRGTRDQIAYICWIIKKARDFQKNSYFCFIDSAKAEMGKQWKQWDALFSWAPKSLQMVIAAMK